ncbi:MAG: hypothetical protein F6K21_02975 [Symploca sp. SIO2D2]|nr:hypothetical protein [Symploca sp. SIO2D2]
MSDYELETKQQPVVAQTVSLGHNFPPISTQYELRHKNLEGKTFWDLLPQLQEPFSPEEHLNYELGYSKEHQSKIDYIYCPWQSYEDRLNEVVGRGFWLQETVGTWIDESGRPVVRSRLSILGVVFEANGYAKPRGKWQGSLMEVAEKDAFKECCERLTGMGRYFRDQLWTIRYVYENTTDHAQKGEMRRLMAQRSKQPGAKSMNSRRGDGKHRQESGLLDALGGNKVVQSKPKPKPLQSQSKSKVQDLYPQHNKLIKNIRAITGHDPQSIINWCKPHGAERPSQLTSEKVYDLVFSMIAGWLEITKNLNPQEATNVLRDKINHLTQKGIPSLEACYVALDELQQLSVRES